MTPTVKLPALDTDTAAPSAHFMQQDEAAYALALLDYISPVTWDDHLAISSAYFITGMNELAMTHAKRAIAISRNPHTLLNLGMTLEVESRWEESLPLAEEAFRLAPSDRRIQCWYSDSMLRMGKFSRAWACYADSHADWTAMRNVLPEWNGHDFLNGKRILVLPAGGYGDDILHIRWLPFLAAQGAVVTLVCPASLQPLLASLPYIHHFVTGSTREPIADILLADYDMFTSLRALPTHFCPTVGDIPTAPYLARGILRSEYVGICSQAGEEKFPRRHRSLTEEQMMQIIHSTEIGRKGWFVQNKFKWKELNNDRVTFRDWKETAECVGECSLVITVDTGVAHLAGALNIPCWIILPGISASYYGVSGPSSPFYPSQRLFRNGGEGIDNSVNLVCGALANLNENSLSIRR